MGAPSPDAAEMPRRRGSLLQADLGDERVVYDPRRRHSFRLNRTAGLLLDRCDGRSRVADVVAELAQAFAVDPRQVSSQLGRALDRFVADGLVAPADRGELPSLADELDRAWGPPPAPPPAPAGSEPTPAPASPADRVEPTHPPHGAGPGAVWRQVLDVVVAATAEEPDLAAELDRVFGSLPLAPDRAATAPTRWLAYRLHRTDGGTIGIDLAGATVGRATSVAAALSFTQWHLNREAVAGASGRVLLHAGAVHRPGGGLVLAPGASNAGKSTLVAGLVRAGCGYVTDELVGLTPGTGQATGYRKAISLDPGSWSLFPEAGPSSSSDPGPVGHPGQEWLVAPTTLHPGALDGPVGGEVSLVVFPRFEAGADTAAESLSPAQALVELIRHDPAAVPLDAAGLDTLALVARRTPAFRLTTGDLTPAVTRVLALARSGSPGSA